MTRATLIINELAPASASRDWKTLVCQALGSEAEVTEIRAANFDDVSSAARAAAARGDELVFAVGGDGTVNAAVNGIGSAPTRVVVVPAGTANDLARTIGGESGLDGADLDDWRPLEIDAICVNNRRFYTVGGPGWAADVAHTANRWRATRLRRFFARAIGSSLYTLACVFVILFSRRLGSRVRIDYTDASDGERKSMAVDAYGVLVANTSRVGESFYLTPHSKCDDGKFELIIFPRRGRLRLLRSVILMKKNRLFELPEIEALQVTSAKLDADAPLRFFGEGETLTSGESFEISLSADPVRLLAPAGGLS